MICGNCNQECRKVTVKYDPRREECEKCASGGLHLEPAWKRDKPTPLWESRPWLYKKTTGPDGETIYQPTDENMSDLEAQVSKQSVEDIAAIEAQKNRPNKPFDLSKAEVVAAKFLEHFKSVRDQYEQANAEYWNTAAEDLKVQ